MALDPKLIEQLKAEHGEVWEMSSAGTDIVFRAPSEAQFNRCIGKMQEDKKKGPEACKELAFSVVVHPSKEAFQSLVSKRPGVALKVAGEALAVASEEELDRAKKL